MATGNRVTNLKTVNRLWLKNGKSMGDKRIQVEKISTAYVSFMLFVQKTIVNDIQSPLVMPSIVN